MNKTKLIRDCNYKFNKELLYDLKDCFPNGFIYHTDEFIAHKKENSYFKLDNIDDELELKCKLLEYLSRHAHKSGTNHSRKYHRDGINRFLKTKFDIDDFDIIYSKLGNGCNRKLCIEFIENDFNMELLGKQRFKKGLQQILF